MSDRCDSCGASMKQHKHRINRHLVRGLALLQASGGGPVNLNSLGMTRSEWDNFQKLRYWDLVEQSGRRGEWKITPKGREFLAGSIRVAVRVVTFRGSRVRYEGDSILAKNVVASFDDIEWYREQAS